MASHTEQIIRSLQKVEEGESDFYASLLYLVLVRLLPDKEPREIANAVLAAYHNLDPEDPYGQ